MPRTFIFPKETATPPGPPSFLITARRWSWATPIKASQSPSGESAMPSIAGSLP
jgi:hypothetical protein